MQLVVVKLQARNTVALRVQEVLTRHGCDISLRVGIHEQSGAECSNEGVILLQVKQDQGVVDSLVADLKALGQLEVKTLSI